jgi:hypothetical protein
MIELVFVLVVLGIVASLGAEIMAQVYSNYITQKGIQKSSVKTELATSIIQNRLSYRIARTTVGRNPNDINDTVLINEIPDATTYPILEWYGLAIDSFNANDANGRPSWSGFCDIEDSNRSNISTPGSNLELLSTIIPNVSDSEITDVALIFSGSRYSSTKRYNIDCIGYTGDRSCISTIGAIADNTNITLSDTLPKTVHEQYSLTRSAYALVPVQTGTTKICDADTMENPDNICDLVLRYDYQPWEGDSYTDAKSKVLVRNISVFRFSGMGDNIRFKICAKERTGLDIEISTCKEKAVIR